MVVLRCAPGTCLLAVRMEASVSINSCANSSMLFHLPVEYYDRAGIYSER